MNTEYLKYEPIKDPQSQYGNGIKYESMMKRQIRKHSSYLQPIFEAVSNSLESKDVSEIEIALSYEKTLVKDVYDLLSIHITDDGEGFTDTNFERIVTLFDDSKGYNNLGTGRIQFLHYFKYTQIRSVYIKERIKHLRTIVLSNDFYNLSKTVIFTSDEIVNDDIPVTTTVSFFVLNNENDKPFFQNLNTLSLKNEILKHYLSKFCLDKKGMPTIFFTRYVNEILDNSSTQILTKEDIPDPDCEEELRIPYSILSDDKKSLIKLSGTESKFYIQSFALPVNVLSRNEVKLTSKGETVDATKFDFSLIKEAPKVGDTYMLFLISSEYFTSHDQDERGKLRLFTRKELLCSNNLFLEPEIVVEDIQENVIGIIINRYPSIREAKANYDLDLEKIASFFSLDLDEIKKMGVKAGESTESILRRFHEYNGIIQAKKEAHIKNLYDSLEELIPGSSNYNKDFNNKVKSLTKLVPELVRSNLTGYLARRKLVLLIFELAIKKQLQCQKEDKKERGRKKRFNQHEKFLHNIFFSQHSTDPKESNLWLLSDEFVHFDGVSEKKLIDIKYKDELFLKEDLSPQERENLKHFEHDDLKTRPDILLFPEEHKCVIIEFKSPEVELTNQIQQINNYASIIRQYSKPKFEITTFYAYIIGEKIDLEAFIRRNPEFETSYYFNYAYCPDKKVYGGNRNKGSMYIEVITFSTLLERAKMRNKVFINQI